MAIEFQGRSWPLPQHSALAFHLGAGDWTLAHVITWQALYWLIELSLQPKLVCLCVCAYRCSCTCVCMCLCHTQSLRSEKNGESLCHCFIDMTRVLLLSLKLGWLSCLCPPQHCSYSHVCSHDQLFMYVLAIWTQALKRVQQILLAIKSSSWPQKLYLSPQPCYPPPLPLQHDLPVYTSTADYSPIFVAVLSRFLYILCFQIFFLSDYIYFFNLQVLYNKVILTKFVAGRPCLLSQDLENWGKKENFLCFQRKPGPHIQVCLKNKKQKKFH